MAGRHQILGILPVRVLALGLAIGAVRTTHVGAFVPVQTEPAQRLENVLLGFCGTAGLVGVFDTQDKLAAVLTGKAQVEQGHVGGTNVRVSRG